MESALDYIRSLAPVSHVIVVLFLLLLPTGILISRRAKSRKLLVVFLVVAWLPAILGLLGAVKICENVTFREHIGGLSEASVERSQALASAIAYMGIAASLPLLVVGIIAALAVESRRRRRSRMTASCA